MERSHEDQQMTLVQELSVLGFSETATTITIIEDESLWQEIDKIRNDLYGSRENKRIQF